MIELKKYPAEDNNKNPIQLTIASGPVIIENEKVLLVKHGKDDFWKFPGGKIYDNNSLQENAKREVKEELGIDIQILGNPFVFTIEKKESENKEHIILFHYRSKKLTKNIKKANDIKKWEWHDINNLPKDCALNIKPTINFFENK